jgi:hypothetical protein
MMLVMQASTGNFLSSFLFGSGVLGMGAQCTSHQLSELLRSSTEKSNMRRGAIPKLLTYKVRYNQLMCKAVLVNLLFHALLDLVVQLAHLLDLPSR